MPKMRGKTSFPGRIKMKKINTKRVLSLLLALTLTAGGISCRKHPDGDPDGQGVDAGNAGAVPSGASAKSEGVLSNVWTGTAYELPEGWQPYNRVTAHYDPSTGFVTCLGSGSVTDEEGEPHSKAAIVTLTGKSYSLDMLDFPADLETADRIYIEYGVLTADVFWYAKTLGKGADYRYFLVRRNLATGEETEAEFRSLFAGSGEHLEGMAVDADGDVWLKTMSEAICVTPEFIRLCSVTFPEGNGEFVATPEGPVWLSMDTPGGKILAQIDKHTGEKTAELPLPDRYSELLYGEGYDYIYTSSGGVYGAKINDKKEIVPECMMDFVNSGINPDLVKLWGWAGEDGLLFRESSGGLDESFRESPAWPAVYRPAGDIFLADITVLEVAYTYELWDGIVTDAIAQFNKNHTDARIVTLDYSVYSKEIGDQTGAERLTMDMVTGLCSPDIILGRPGEDVQIEQLLRKHLYVDLGPYLDSDPEVNRDTLFGSVLTAFSDEDGAVWGLPNHLSFETLIANRAVLEQYGMGGKTGGASCGWSLEEFLDFAEALPPDIVLIERLTQESAADTILGNYGLGAFFDEAEGVCSFDDPVFLRWLRFLASIPKDENELKKRSPFYSTEGAERYDWLMNGRVALDYLWGYDTEDFKRFEASFGTKDWVLIGFPSSGASGTEISTQSACCITTFCPKPDLAWEFVRSVVLSRKGSDFAGTLLPALRSRCESAAGKLLNQDIVQYFSGNMSTHTPKQDPPMTKEDLREPGFIIDFTEEDRERILAELDRAGQPIVKLVPAEVRAIVDEEISTYLGGLGSAEDCAKKIQSRASIWLAEHS